MSLPGPEFDTSATPPHEWEAAAQEQKAVLAGILTGSRAQRSAVDVVEKADWGDPLAVLDESRGAELVVVGSHGSRWIRRGDARLGQPRTAPPPLLPGHRRPQPAVTYSSGAEVAADAGVTCAPSVRGGEQCQRPDVLCRTIPRG